MSTLPFAERVRHWLSKIPLSINRAYYSRFGHHDFNPDGTDVFEEDWDTLVILDACRYDTFANVSDLPGQLEQRTSRGSTTDEFMQANIGARDFRDTVYVTATPSVHVTEEVNPAFYTIIDLWKNYWDEKLRTVRPEDVTKAAIKAHERYPNKRLFVHYLQPHYPFIGPTGRRHFDHAAVNNPVSGDEELAAKFWDTVGTRINDVPESTVYEAYRENLELTLPHVHKLMKNVSGKTVITADHGEMINNRCFPVPNRIYGHPAGLYTSELVDVPWHTYTDGQRRRIETGSAIMESDFDTDTAKERLSDLGYT
jgi:hypothetical protein